MSSLGPYQGNTIVVGDCLDVMSKLPENSINLIAVDPPYFKVKNEPWDRQWDTAGRFLNWIGKLCEQWYRLLKPNGSLYVFAGRLESDTEIVLRKWFTIINRITWAKPKFSTKAEMFDKDLIRSYFPTTERIFFCEHYGADNIAKGESRYEAKCDELRGFVFESLRAYLDGERKRGKIDKEDCNVACGFSRSAGGMASRHYFSTSQWALPTAEHYTALQKLFNLQGTRPAPPYEDYHEAPRSRFEPDTCAKGRDEYLRAEYEYLRAEYEDLRRPFSVSVDVPYTDVWDFKTVQSYPGKHPCEKPLKMMEHIIRMSSREGDTVLDCCMGSGVTLRAAENLGRKTIGIEMSEEWCDIAMKRLRPDRQMRIF